MKLILDGLLWVVLSLALYTDLKSGKIYNKLTFPAFLLGVVFNGMTDGWKGSLLALQGGLVGIAILFPFFALGWLKAGDVKLMAVLGAFKGTSFVLHDVLFSLVSGGVIAAVLLVRKKLIKRFGVKFVNMLFLFFATRKPQFEGDKSLVFPYSMSIFLGTAITYLFFRVDLSLW